MLQMFDLRAQSMCSEARYPCKNTGVPHSQEYLACGGRGETGETRGLVEDQRRSGERSLVAAVDEKVCLLAILADLDIET